MDKRVLLIGFLLAGTLVYSNNDDWPQYRGPNRDGISAAKGLAASWPAEGPKELWRVPIGIGFSSISVVDGQLFTMYTEEGIERLGCFDAATGKKKWSQEIGRNFEDSFGDGPRSGPTVDGSVVYALGSYGDLIAVNVKDGTLAWRVSFEERYQGKAGRWGYSASPLVDGNRLLVEAGGGEGKGVAALNKQSGETLWTVYNGHMGYSSPIVAEIHGVRQYIFLATNPAAQEGAPPTQTAIGISTQGTVLWRHDVPGFIVAMPVFVGPDKVFVSASNDDGARLLQIEKGADGFSAKELWQSRFMKNHFNSSIVVDGHVYGFSNATLTCMDLESGERKWVKRGLGKGSLIQFQDRMLALSDKGKLTMFALSPEGYQEVAAVQPLKGKSWTMPTIAAGKLYLRNQTEMLCMDLK